MYKLCISNPDDHQLEGSYQLDKSLKAKYGQMGYLLTEKILP